MIHNSCLLSLASSIILFKICIGMSVDSFFKPAKLGPLRTLNLLRISLSLLPKIFIISFLKHSIKMIGLVCANEKFQSVGFGIGYKLVIFQSKGTKLWV